MTERRTSAGTWSASEASRVQHRAQAAGDDLLGLRNHALYDLGSRQDRVNQTGVLSNQNRGMVHITRGEPPPPGTDTRMGTRCRWGRSASG
jgi:hypothetical protein